MSDSLASRARSAMNTVWSGQEGQTQKYATEDPDAPGARDVQNAHEWDDPDRSWADRLTPNSVAQWLIVTAATLALGGLAFYLFPLLSPLFRNPIFIGVSLFIAYSIGLWLHGRESGIREYIDLDKSVIYYGSDVDVRLGRVAGEEGNETLFEPLRRLGFGGFAKGWLQRRDLPYEVSKLRNKGHDAGKQPVRDRLNMTTQMADTENFGTVLVTHAAGMEYDPFGTASDRYTELPATMDEDVAEDARLAIEQLEALINQLEKQVDVLKQSNEDLSDLRDAQTIPQLEQTLQMMSVVSQMMDRRRQDESGRDGDSIELEGAEERIFERMKEEDY